jgi:hypothetical protein
MHRVPSFSLVIAISDALARVMAMGGSFVMASLLTNYPRIVHVPNKVVFYCRGSDGLGKGAIWVSSRCQLPGALVT